LLPIRQSVRLTPFPYTTLFRSDRPVRGDVVEGLVAAPRQHARERVHALQDVLLPVLAGGDALDLGVLLRTPHGQREPGLVVVVSSEEHTSELQSRFALLCCLMP